MKLKFGQPGKGKTQAVQNMVNKWEVDREKTSAMIAQREAEICENCDWRNSVNVCSRCKYNPQTVPEEKKLDPCIHENKKSALGCDIGMANVMGCGNSHKKLCDGYESKPTEQSTPRTVMCLDNKGLEDKFEVGVIYPMKDYVDGQLITVYDMNGELQKVFKERFNRVR